MKPPPFLYARPRSLEEALVLLRDSGPDAKVLAGGQSLVPLLNFRLARPSVLIDLNLVPDLTYVRRTNGHVAVGATTRQRALETDPAARRACPILSRALSHVGHLQIRHRGTVGGSLAHADPAAELPAVAVALDAELTVASMRGTRTIRARDFFDGPFMTKLEPDEVLTEARFPVTDDGRVAFLEFARRSGDFALGGVALAVWFAGEGAGDSGAGTQSMVERAGLAALGMGPTPIRLAGAEQAILGRPLDAEVLSDAAAAASAEVEPFTDNHADAGYRRDLVGTLLTRALKEVAAR
jgi:carbon-monoxide dehydrogenase medium subunit